MSEDSWDEFVPRLSSQLLTVFLWLKFQQRQVEKYYITFYPICCTFHVFLYRFLTEHCIKCASANKDKRCKRRAECLKYILIQIQGISLESYRKLHLVFRSLASLLQGLLWVQVTEPLMRKHMQTEEVRCWGAMATQQRHRQTDRARRQYVEVYTEYLLRWISGRSWTHIIVNKNIIHDSFLSFFI